MDKEQSTPKDRSEHKPIDPGRNAAREQREPGKKYEPKRSEPEPTTHRKEGGRN